jgi:hypothetical protein
MFITFFLLYESIVQGFTLHLADQDNTGAYGKG